MKLGGWARLGLVFSILWIVFVVALVAYQFNSATPGSFGALVHYIPGTTPDAASYTIEGKVVQGIIWDILAINYPVALAILLIPLASLWLGIPILVYVFRWVRKGFRDQP